MAAVTQASRRTCFVLRVKILRAENVTLGFWHDLMDTPDPYVKLYLPLSPNGKRKTKTVDDNPNPTWNETFEFYMDPELDNVMSVTLMDADVVFDDEVQTVHFNIKELKLELDGKESNMDVVFNEVSHVYMNLHLSTYTEIPEGVRFSTNICDEEIAFQHKRKEFVFNAMQAVLGERGPKNINEVPTVAILGSGGGFRAMTALSGTTCALKDLGIFDCSMYMAVLSGSSWYTTTLYSHPDWPKIHPVEVNNEIRKNIANNWVRLLFIPSWIRKSISAIRKKKQRGEPVSLTDLLGYLLRDTILLNRKNPVLSDQRKILKDGTVPMPLYACTHVAKDLSAEVFNEWVELSPYEVGILEYGTFLTSEKFGNKYFCGACVAEYPELPLHFIQGFCGSAHTVLLQRVLGNPSNPDKAMKELKEIRHDGSTAMKEFMAAPSTDDVNKNNNADNEDSEEETLEDAESTKVIEEIRDKSTKEKIAQYLVEKINFLKTREGRAAQVNNFLRGLQLDKSPKDHPKDEVDHPKDEVDHPKNEVDHPNDDVNNAKCRVPTDSNYKRMFVCDAGLVFNSPYPLILRKERQVDLILSFDYSAREKDVSSPFVELIKAEQWAKDNKYPFPPINHEEQYKEFGLREYYVFKDDKDPKCPTVIHFPLVNNLFQKFKSPGIPRVNLKEVEAGKLPIFEDPDNSYGSFHFQYQNEAFDRLVELANFNVKVCRDVIYDAMSECVFKKRSNTNAMRIITRMKTQTKQYFGKTLGF